MSTDLYVGKTDSWFQQVVPPVTGKGTGLKVEEGLDTLLGQVSDPFNQK